MNFVLQGNGIAPTRSTVNSAGWDLYAVGDSTVHTGSVTCLDINVKVALYPGTYAQIYSRSSMARDQVVVVGGVIDADYRKTIGVMLMNLGGSAYNIKRGDKIAQLVIHKIGTQDLVQWTQFPDDPAINFNKRSLPVHYQDLLNLLVEELAVHAAHFDPTSDVLYNPAEFARRATEIAANKKSFIINKTRTGGFGSTGR